MMQKHILSSNSHHEFLIIYTSGTVQEPKGVVHSTRSLTKSIADLVTLIDEKPGDILGTQLPHYMLLGIAAGIPVHILSSGKDPKKELVKLNKTRLHFYLERLRSIFH